MGQSPFKSCACELMRLVVDILMGHKTQIDSVLRYIIFFLDIGNWTGDLAFARQVLCHWNIFPARVCILKVVHHSLFLVRKAEITGPVLKFSWALGMWVKKGHGVAWGFSIYAEHNLNGIAYYMNSPLCFWVWQPWIELSVFICTRYCV